ncbi:MAG: DUF1232 domain-containing protein [Hyphomicrobiaceae bacterium]|nr:DUF1232 domain-containing protein [Hyphomicrobiaceae bacterium]MCC0023655.1 DUF1232 domain-containing protein [Hyphomicrobiaceae bacterium]
MNRILARLARFRNHLVILWHAFWHPETPFYLKALMLAVVAYVISPIDLMPDIFAFVGWIDDALLLAFAVEWITSRLPQNQIRPDSGPYDDGPTINGTARRM